MRLVTGDRRDYLVTETEQEALTRADEWNKDHDFSIARVTKNPLGQGWVVIVRDGDSCQVIGFLA